MTRESELKKAIWKYYRDAGRHTLPWRKTKDPYKILVSEVMLQQTQVERVIPKYAEFLRRFPTLRSLAQASLRDVLHVWQGLGYNRRARMLHETATYVVKELRGSFPATNEDLMALPGVGPYTAGAIMAFAYDTAVPLVETNIRSVIIHHFFGDDVDVDDREVLAKVSSIMDTKRAREWYYAMMDYGAYLKKTHGNPNTRSKHYARQSAFKGSDREIRGALIRTLLEGTKTRKDLSKALSFEMDRIDAQLERLTEEGMVEEMRGRFRVSA